MGKSKFGVISNNTENIKEFKSEEQQRHDKCIKSAREALAAVKASDKPVAGVCTLIVFADGTTSRYQEADYMWVTMVGALMVAATRQITFQEPISIDTPPLKDEDE